MKHSRKFIFDTPVNVPAYLKSKKQIALCYARIEGIGYYYPTSHNDTEREDDPESIYGFDIEKVTLKSELTEQDSTIAYRCSHELSDTFADIIEGATWAHMAYLFDDMVAEYWQRPPIMSMREADHTDANQDNRVYQVISIAGTPEQLTDKKVA